MENSHEEAVFNLSLISEHSIKTFVDFQEHKKTLSYVVSMVELVEKLNKLCNMLANVDNKVFPVYYSLNSTYVSNYIQNQQLLSEMKGQKVTFYANFEPYSKLKNLVNTFGAHYDEIITSDPDLSSFYIRDRIKQSLKPIHLESSNKKNEIDVEGQDLSNILLLIGLRILGVLFNYRIACLTTVNEILHYAISVVGVQHAFTLIDLFKLSDLDFIKLQHSSHGFLQIDTEALAQFIQYINVPILATTLTSSAIH